MNAANWHETVEELSKVGIRVRIQHVRRFKFSAEFGPELATVGAFNALPSLMVSPKDLFVLDPSGGETVCQLFLTSAEPHQLIVEESTRCNPVDHYNKRIGRTKALGRALHALTLLRAEGQIVSIEDGPKATA